MPSGGHNRFKPTDAQRAQVEALRAYGAPLPHICQFVLGKNGQPISVKTLKEHFSRELEVGKWNVVQTVAQTLINSARGTPAEFDAQGKQVRAERAPDTTAAIFILKALGGWVDRQQQQHTGADGKPLPPGQPQVIYLYPEDKKL